MSVLRLESSIERAVVEYAKLRGCTSIKLSTNGVRGAAGWPDRLFLAHDRRVMWIEFKRLGGKLTALQQKRHAELYNLGWVPRTVFTVDQGKECIDLLVEGTL